MFPPELDEDQFQLRGFLRPSGGRLSHTFFIFNVAFVRGSIRWGGGMRRTDFWAADHL